MTFNRLVEIGRIAFMTGEEEFEGKICAICDVIDANRALVDGPGVKRQGVRFKNLHLTEFVIKIPHSARTRTVRKAWEAADITKKWEATTWANKLVKRQLRANMTDFDRFKLMKAKQMRNRIVRKHMAKIKKSDKPKATKVKAPKAKAGGKK